MIRVQVTVFIHRPWIKVNIKGYGCILVCKCVLKYFKAVTYFYSLLAVVIDDLSRFFLDHMAFIVFFSVQFTHIGFRSHVRKPTFSKRQLHSTEIYNEKSTADRYSSVHQDTAIAFVYLWVCSF